MTASQPALVVLGVLLIGLGLVYPMIALLRLNRQLGERDLRRGQVVTLLAQTGLLPLTAVLGGFWLLAPAFRRSFVFTAALVVSAILLATAVVARRRLDRPR